MSKKRLFLIDGNSFCYRAFYAIRSLSTSKGQPTNAVYGFVTMLNKIVKDNSPDMLAVISALYAAADPGLAAGAFIELFGR